MLPKRRGHRGWWLKVCSDYLEYSRRRAAAGKLAADHLDNTVRTLNELCQYCGALPVAELRKGHVQFWVENHSTWRSLATHRNVISIVLAAFNYAQERTWRAKSAQWAQETATAAPAAVVFSGRGASGV